MVRTFDGYGEFHEDTVAPEDKVIIHEDGSITWPEWFLRQVEHSHETLEALYAIGPEHTPYWYQKNRDEINERRANQGKRSSGSS